MVQLAQWQEKFAEIGVNVAAMTYDKRSILADFHAKNNLNYPLLQDEDIKHVNAYGVRNEDYGPGESGYGIPLPGVLFINSSGIIEFKIAVPGYRKRPPFDAILDALVNLEGVD